MVLSIVRRIVFCILMCPLMVSLVISAQSSADIYISVSPSGMLLAEAQGMSITIKDIATDTTLNTFNTVGTQYTAPAWSPDSTRLAIPNNDILDLWSNPSDPTNATRYATYNMGLLGVIGAMDWHPTQNWIAIGAGGIIDIIDTNNTNLLQRLRHGDIVFELNWSPDGQYLVSAGASDELNIWDGSTGQNVFTIWNTANQRSIPYDRPSALSASWSPDGTQLAWVSSDGTVRFWNVDFSTDFFQSSDHDPTNLDVAPDAVLRVAWSPDGQYIASAGNTGVVIVWNATTRMIEQTLQATSPVNSIAWLSDSSQLVYADQVSGVHFAPIDSGGVCDHSGG